MPVGLDDLEINGPTGYGYEPLQQRLAAKCHFPHAFGITNPGTRGRLIAGNRITGIIVRNLQPISIDFTITEEGHLRFPSTAATPPRRD